MLSNTAHTQQQQMFLVQANQNAYLNGSRSIVGLNGVNNAIHSTIERGAMSSAGAVDGRATDIGRGPYTRPAMPEIVRVPWERPAHWAAQAQARDEARQLADMSWSKRFSRALTGCCNPLAASKR